MNRAFSRLLSIGIAAACLLAGASRASTWIVDDNGGPGVDFTDLPAAIAAAQPGDVLVVLDGNYSQVIGLSKGITIVGQGVVTLAPLPFGSNLQISNLPAGPPLSITNVRATGILVQGCAGSVVFQRVRAGTVLIQSSADVRLHQMDGPVSSVSVTSSRVEIAGCTVIGKSGNDGQSGNPLFPATSGQAGVSISGASRVHLARTSARGGNGGNNSQAGDGGFGIWVDSGAELILDGGGIASIQGGNGGLGDDCSMDGDGADGLRVTGGTVTRSGATYAGGAPGSCGNTGAPVFFSSGTDVQLAPDAPTLAMSGSPVPGGSVTWTIYAEPGSAAVLILGRAPIVMPVPGILVEQLTTALRTYDLGTVSGSGFVSTTLALPAGWPLGTRLVAQGRVTFPAIAEVRHTSSSALIAR